MTYVTIIKEHDVKRVESTRLTTVISSVDGLGNRESWRVTWLPEVVWGVMTGHENIGEVPAVWATEDTPPAWVQRIPGSPHQTLQSFPVQVTGDRQAVVEAVQVDSLGDLTPGTYVAEQLP